MTEEYLFPPRTMAQFWSVLAVFSVAVSHFDVSMAVVYAPLLTAVFLETANYIYYRWY